VSTTNGTISSWRDFWSAPLAHDFQTEASWNKNAKLFAERSHTILGYRDDDVVLDVGSGPGATAEALRTRVAEVHCAEVSEAYITAARKRFQGSPNVTYHELGAGLHEPRVSRAAEVLAHPLQQRRAVLPERRRGREPHLERQEGRRARGPHAHRRDPDRLGRGPPVLPRQPARGLGARSTLASSWAGSCSSRRSAT
jgi:hypothetical protein